MFKKKKEKKLKISKINYKKEGKSKTFFLKLSFYFLLFFFAGFSFWILFFSDFTKIKKIEVFGFEQEAISQLVKEDLSFKYFNFIPQDNIFLFSKNKIRRKINNKIIFAKNIEIRKKFPDKIIILSEERKQKLVWCQESDWKDCYLIDGEGEVFYKIEKEEDFIKNVPLVFSQSKIDLMINKKVADVDFIKFCVEIGSLVEDKINLNFEKKYYTPSMMSEEIKMITEQGWYVYFNTASNPEKQAIILKSLLKKDFISQNIAELDYVDLRIDGRILYKLKSDGKEKESENVKSEEDTEEIF